MERLCLGFARWEILRSKEKNLRVGVLDGHNADMMLSEMVIGIAKFREWLDIWQALGGGLRQGLSAR